jgi:arginyl-tRNA synthetase
VKQVLLGERIQLTENSLSAGPFVVPPQGDKFFVTNEEKSLALHLLSFQDYLNKAVEEYKPSTLCRYAIELCQYINSYYQSHHIIDESNLEQTAHRIAMIRKAQHYLGQAMDLVCVPRVEVM